MEARANEVRTMLITHGIDRSRIQTKAGQSYNDPSGRRVDGVFYR